MPSTRRRATPPSPRRVSRAADASPSSDLLQIIEMLIKDHADVDRLFRKMEKLRKVEDDSRYDILQEVCAILTVHATIEEQLFYPEARDAGEEAEEDLVDEAEVEHDHIRELVQELKDMSEDDPLCDAKTKVLSAYVRHHVKEEEGKLFPRLRREKPDFTGLYERMLDLRRQLEQTQMGPPQATVVSLSDHGRVLGLPERPNKV